MRIVTCLICIAALMHPSEVFSQERVKVGLSVALSGNTASIGEDQKNAVIYANKIFSNNGYDLVFEDDKCNGKDAVTVAQKLINVDKVKYVMGFSCSGALLASAPIYQRAGILLFTSASSAPKVSELGDYVFRTWPSDVRASQVLYEYVAARHSSVGIITEETEYARQLAQAFFTANTGGKTKIYEETFLSNETDFKSLIVKLRQTNTKAVFVNSQNEVTFVQILRQLHQFKYAGAIYGAFYPESATFRKLAGDMAEGIIYVDAPSAQDVIGDKARETLEGFRKEMGEPKYSPMVVLLTIDAFYAMHQAEINSTNPKEYLHHNGFPGAIGEFQFDEHGDIKGLQPIMKIIKDGKGSKIE